MASHLTPPEIPNTPPSAFPDLTAPYPYPNPNPYPYDYPNAYAYTYPYPAPSDYPWVYAPAAPRQSAWALASMICGIISIASFQTIIAILAVIFGFIGLNEVKKSAGQVEGHGFAMTGIVLGFISIGLGILIIALYIVFIIAISTLPSTPD
ncbi:MAG TPA: DUF4190 domain-containing protein [Ktedonobacterales bacterium]|nr:DUF4190 domain-containing protein [Ktedonobacterales bacterium]